MFIKLDKEKYYVNRANRTCFTMDGVPADESVHKAVSEMPFKCFGHLFTDCSHAECSERETVPGMLYEGINRPLICMSKDDENVTLFSVGRSRLVYRNIREKFDVYNNKYDFDFMENPTPLNLLATVQSVGSLLVNCKLKDMPTVTDGSEMLQWISEHQCAADQMRMFATILANLHPDKVKSYVIDDREWFYTPRHQYAFGFNPRGYIEVTSNESDSYLCQSGSNELIIGIDCDVVDALVAFYTKSEIKPDNIYTQVLGVMYGSRAKL